MLLLQCMCVVCVQIQVEHNFQHMYFLRNLDGTKNVTKEEIRFLQDRPTAVFEGNAVCI